jgi:hypothetical protein
VSNKYNITILSSQSNLYSQPSSLQQPQQVRVAPVARVVHVPPNAPPARQKVARVVLRLQRLQLRVIGLPPVRVDRVRLEHVGLVDVRARRRGQQAQDVGGAARDGEGLADRLGAGVVGERLPERDVPGGAAPGRRHGRVARGLAGGELVVVGRREQELQRRAVGDGEGVLLEGAGRVGDEAGDGAEGEGDDGLADLERLAWSKVGGLGGRTLLASSDDGISRLARATPMSTCSSFGSMNAW